MAQVGSQRGKRGIGMRVVLPIHGPGCFQYARHLLGTAPPQVLRLLLETARDKGPAMRAPGGSGVAGVESDSNSQSVGWDGFLVCAGECRYQRPRMVQPDIPTRYI